MAKQWKKSLEQSDILSDGTPFDGANIDAPISSAGTTQDTIADGADESDGRWQGVYKTPLTVLQPDHLASSGSGAAPNFQTDGMTMVSGSDGDWGALAGYDPIPNGTSLTGTYLMKVELAGEVSIGSLSDAHGIGLSFPDSGWDTADGIALFRPHVGDNTSGNVRIDSAGTTTDGSISYPSYNNLQSYTLLVDESGEYLTAGHTGFYVNGDPRKGDAPNADLAATPDWGDFDDNYFGIFYESEGNAQSLFSTHLELTVKR